MSKLEEAMAEALKLVEPSKGEAQRVQSMANMAYKKVLKAASEDEFKPDVVLGGSFAKGTWLRGEADVDIFVEFSKELNKDQLERHGLDIGLKAMEGHNPSLRYAEHPYVEAYVNEVRVNVVPCFKVERGEWKSAADRSPYHTRYMVEKLDDELRREVRLLKKFMKGVGVYGAEIATQGFSGYFCEVLTLNYRTFASVLRGAAKWVEGQIITLEGVEEDVKKRFEQASLIVLDPVDAKRNLGTAVSLKKLSQFILAAMAFLERPKLAFFKGRREIDLKVRGAELMGNLVTLKFKHAKRSIDVLWGQLKRSLSHISKQLKLANFEVIRASCASDEEGESALIFLLEDLDQPRIEVKKGPKVFRHEDSWKFIEKNLKPSKLVWVGEDGRLYALIERKVRSIDEFFHKLLRGPRAESGIAPGLLDDVTKTYEVYRGETNLQLASSRPWLARELNNIISSEGILLYD